MAEELGIPDWFRGLLELDDGEESSPPPSPTQPDKYTARWKFKTGDEVFSVNMTPDARHILAGSNDDHVYLLDEHGHLLWKAALGGDVMGTAFVHGGQTIIAGSERNGRLTFFDLAGQVQDTRDLGGGFEVMGIDATDDGQYILVGGQGGVRFLDGRRRRELWRYEDERRIWHVALCPEAGRIVAASRNNCVLLLDWDGRLVWKYEGSEDFVGVAISADGSVVLAGDWDHTLYCLNADRSVRWKYRGSSQWFKGVAMTPGAEYIVAARQGPKAGNQGAVYLLDGEGKLLWEHLVERNAQDVAITPDGRLIAVGTQAGEVILLENLLPSVGYSVVPSGPFAGAVARAHVTHRR
jgi:outer membrane protein assembly factor BamB